MAGYSVSKPFNNGHLQVDSIHRIYYAEYGNPEGIPIVYLHGGPGSGFSESSLRFFDPKAFRIIALDQRGAGKSLPYAEIKNNSPQELVDDLDKLRKHLGVDKWHVFGGSWGSTLALLYAEDYPDDVLSLTVRGIYMNRKEEVKWFVKGMGKFFPDVQKDFEDFLKPWERKSVLRSYFNRLTSPKPEVHMPAAHSWSAHESDCVSLEPSPRVKLSLTGTFTRSADPLSIARLEAHYMLNHVLPDDFITAKDRIDKIRHIPTMIFQGKYDVICPPKTARDLKDAFPEAYLYEVLSGHSQSDPDIEKALLSAMNRIKKHGSPAPRNEKPRAEGPQNRTLKL